VHGEIFGQDTILGYLHTRRVGTDPSFQATLRKELGARRTVQKKAEEHWTASSDSICQTRIDCHTYTKRIALSRPRHSGKRSGVEKKPTQCTPLDEAC
jgi:hypothetical protein